MGRKERAGVQADTLPKLLIEKARWYGSSRTALREKHRGVWQEVSWAEYLRQVRELCLGFVSLGLRRGEKVCIIGANRPAWLYTELGVQAAGGVSVGLYQDSPARELADAIRHCDARFVVAGDQEQVATLLAVRGHFPSVERLVYFDPGGVRTDQDPWLLSLPELQKVGARHRDPPLFERLVNQGSGEDVAMICYTSGATGAPKGAMLRHRNLINVAINLAKVDPLTDRDHYVSCQPLAWIGEQIITCATALVVGCTVHFPQSPATIRQALREVGPRVLFGPPRVWEEVLTRVQMKIVDGNALKRWLFDKLLPWRYRMADRRFNRQRPTWTERLMYRLADLLIFRAIRNDLGLRRLKRCYTVGGALGPELFRFCHALGVNLKQIYGSTEVAGIAALHRDGDIRSHTVGRPLDGQVKVSERGEILIKSGGVFAGYYKEPMASAAAIRDGWLQTGDAGYSEPDSGHLVVIGRCKEISQLGNGELFSPQQIESKLKFSPYIREAMVIGQARPNVVAMINIDRAATETWGGKRGIPYMSYADLAQREEVLRLIEGEVAGVNGTLPKAARIVRFVILHRELDPDHGEMTPTRKLRRGMIAEQYGPLIEGLYTPGVTVIPVADTVRYRDGQVALIKMQLKVLFPARDGPPGQE